MRPRRVGQLVLDHGALAGVHDGRRCDGCEVRRRQQEPRHAGVPVVEDAVAVDDPHVRRGVRALDDPQHRGVHSLGHQRVEDGATGEVGAHRADVCRAGATCDARARPR